MWLSRRSGWICECWGPLPRGDPQVPTPLSLPRLNFFSKCCPVTRGWPVRGSPRSSSLDLVISACPRAQPKEQGTQGTPPGHQCPSWFPATTALRSLPVGRLRGSQALPSGRSPCSKNLSTPTLSGEVGKEAGKLGLSQATQEPHPDWGPAARLLDVVHSEKKLYLVFEFLSQDLRKFMDSTAASELPLHVVKVWGGGWGLGVGGKDRVDQLVRPTPLLLSLLLLTLPVPELPLPAAAGGEFLPLPSGHPPRPEAPKSAHR